MNLDYVQSESPEPHSVSASEYHPLLDGILTSLTVWVITLLSTGLVYVTARHVYVTEFREELLRRATLAAGLVDGDLHGIFRSPEQEDSAQYEQAVAPLRRVMQADPHIRFLYTAALVNDMPHFILDATPPGDLDGDGVEDHSSIMEEYVSPDDEMLVALREGRATVMREPKKDQWGMLLSAYAPMRDQSGQLVGIVGVDLTAEQFWQRLRSIEIAALAAIIPATLLSLLAGLFRYHAQVRRLKFMQDQKCAQLALTKALRRFEDLVENTPSVAIQGIDRNGIICHWNYASSVLYGYCAADAVGRRIQDLLISPSAADEFDAALEELWKRGRPAAPREWKTRAKDGATRWVYSSMFPILSGSCVEEVFCIDVDITDRKCQEEEIAAYAAELELANAAAQKATRAKSEFLANMSHEIRTPMTAILGFADMLLDEPDIEHAPWQRIEAIRTIQRNGQHLVELINDILDLSKVEAGKLQVERVTCCPSQILTDVISLMRVRADAKKLPLSLEFDGPVPEWIKSDPLRLRQILINLVGNAIKFTLEGSVHVVAGLITNADGPTLFRIQVVDTGVGLSQQQIAELFTPFTQVDTSATRKFGGTGLGLSISKRLAEMLGGEIAVTSAPGAGSTFEVTVDAGDLTGVRMLTSGAKSASAARTVTPRPPQISGDPETTENRLPCIQGRILLVEDGPDNQRLIGFVLGKAGALVALAENGRIGCDMALGALHGGEPFDVILMDMQMPVMDGYAATIHLRSVGYSGPILALTAHAMEGDAAKCLAAGCDAYLTKPIDRVKLIRTIARYLRHVPTSVTCALPEPAAGVGVDPDACGAHL